MQSRFFANLKKKCAARAKLGFFLLIRSIFVVFTLLVAFSLSLVLLDFIFSLRNLWLNLYIIVKEELFSIVIAGSMCGRQSLLTRIGILSLPGAWLVGMAMIR